MAGATAAGRGGRGRKKGAGKKKKRKIDKSRNLFKFVLVLLSASIERVGVSRMRHFKIILPFGTVLYTGIKVNFWLVNFK